MIIKDIRTTLLRIPFVEKPMMRAGFDRQREFLVIEVETASGIVGLGYIYFPRPGFQTVNACLKEMIIPQVLGRDATEVEAIWRDLWTATYPIGRMGVTMFAQSALDVALWDAVGKHANMPLHRLWGNACTEVPIYGSGVWRGLGRDGMIEKAKRYIAAGYKAIKMQAGHTHDLKTDVANVFAMRDAIGPDIDILIDINMAWTADVAIRMGRQFEEADVYWMEEPVIADDMAGYFRVAEALDLRVVGGENHFTRYDLRPFLENPKIPILQPDFTRGGVTEMRKIAALADTWGMQIAPHRYHEISLQIMAAIPNGLILEHQAEMDDLWVEPVEIADGMAKAPERPGHGLAFKEEVLRDYAVTG
jgi:L-alanine-DL-glutamate epimerase-like enolase superfamily enzyme